MFSIFFFSAPWVRQLAKTRERNIGEEIQTRKSNFQEKEEKKWFVNFPIHCEWMLREPIQPCFPEKLTGQHDSAICSTLPLSRLILNHILKSIKTGNVFFLLFLSHFFALLLRPAHHRVQREVSELVEKNMKIFQIPTIKVCLLDMQI